MLRSSLLLVSVLAPLGALTLPSRLPEPSAAEQLAAAARTFLDTLDETGREKAALAFDDAERTTWNFVPGIYPGVPLADLDLAQRRAAHALLRAALGTQGTLKTLAIVRLEQVLRDRAARAGRTAEVAMRDPERYALAVFGAPDAEGAWGFRFQGHHVSLNFTVVEGRAVTATPKFFGANPHELREGPYAGERVLAAEEDEARQLLHSLSEEQRAIAVLADEAPADIILGPGREADLLGPPKGLAWADMTGDQQRMLFDLLAVYVRDFAPELVGQEMARIRNAGLDDVRFAWMGGTARGEPHYYRIHGPDFVVEYDNIQNGANHSHTVWHDLRNGFGGDLLRQHHEAAHRDR